MYDVGSVACFVNEVRVNDKKRRTVLNKEIEIISKTRILGHLIDICGMSDIVVFCNSFSTFSWTPRVQIQERSCLMAMSLMDAEACQSDQSKSPGGRVDKPAFDRNRSLLHDLLQRFDAIDSIVSRLPVQFLYSLSWQ